MLASNHPGPISLDHLKQIMAQLSVPAQLKKLAADVRFFRHQAKLITSAVGHMQQEFLQEQSCRQLLTKAPQLLRQLAVVTTAVLQQLAAQRDSEVQVSRAAGLLCNSLAKLLQLTRACPDFPAPGCAPDDTASLRMVQETGGYEGFCTSGAHITPCWLSASITAIITTEGSAWLVSMLCCMVSLAKTTSFWLMAHGWQQQPFIE
jgi:hypothetical protein